MVFQESGLFPWMDVETNVRFGLDTRGVPRAEAETRVDAALTLARERLGMIWPVEVLDVELARTLVDLHPELPARDLLHLASCKRRGVDTVKTFDRGLAAAFPRRSFRP